MGRTDLLLGIWAALILLPFAYDCGQSNQSQLDMLLTAFRTEYASLGYLSLIDLFNEKRDHHYCGAPGTSSPSVPAADTLATVSCRSPSGQGAWTQIHWFIRCATNEGG